MVRTHRTVQTEPELAPALISARSKSAVTRDWFLTSDCQLNNHSIAKKFCSPATFQNWRCQPFQRVLIHTRNPAKAQPFPRADRCSCLAQSSSAPFAQNSAVER